MEQVTNALGNVLNDIVGIIPELLAFVAILVIGYIVAKVLQRVTDAVLERVGFDRLVERGGIRKALDRSKYDASDLMARIVYYGVILLTLVLAFNVFGPNPVSLALNQAVAYLPNLFVAGLIIVIGAAVASAVREIVDAAIGGLSYGKWVAAFAATAIMVVAAFAALDTLDIAPLIVTGLFYGVVAIVVGVTIVAVGGGGITPMRQLWQGAIDRMQAEAPRMRMETQGAQDRVKQRAQERMEQAKKMQPTGAGVGGGPQQMGAERPGGNGRKT